MIFHISQLCLQLFGISIDASAGCVAIQIGILKAAVTTNI
jgi:hypothetical protein